MTPGAGDDPDSPAGDSALSAPLGWLIYTNLFIALGAGLLTAATYPMLGAPARVDAVVALVALSTLVVYNLDRLVAVQLETGGTSSPRLLWYAQHRVTLWAIVALATIGAAVAAMLLPWTTFAALSPLGLISLGYCLPLPVGRGRRRRRLKDVPGLKVFLVALTWTGATVLAPATVLESAPDWFALLTATASRLLFFLAICLPFDVRDLKRDTHAGILTLPRVIGVDRTRWLIGFCLLGCLAAAAARTDPFSLAILGITLYVAAFAWAMEPDRHDHYYSLWIDGAIHIHGVLLLIAAGFVR